jgi:hypothetical protein
MMGAHRIMGAHGMMGTHEKEYFCLELMNSMLFSGAHEKGFLVWSS